MVSSSSTMLTTITENNIYNDGIIVINVEPLRQTTMSYNRMNRMIIVWVVPLNNNVSIVLFGIQIVGRKRVTVHYYRYTEEVDSRTLYRLKHHSRIDTKCVPLEDKIWISNDMETSFLFNGTTTTLIVLPHSIFITYSTVRTVHTVPPSHTPYLIPICIDVCTVCIHYDIQRFGDTSVDIEIPDWTPTNFIVSDLVVVESNMMIMVVLYYAYYYCMYVKWNYSITFNADTVLLYSLDRQKEDDEDLLIIVIQNTIIMKKEDYFTITGPMKNYDDLGLAFDAGGLIIGGSIECE